MLCGMEDILSQIEKLLIDQPQILRHSKIYSQPRNLKPMHSRLLITDWIERLQSLLCQCKCINKFVLFLRNFIFAQLMCLIYCRWFLPMSNYLDDVRQETTVFGSELLVGPGSGSSLSKFFGPMSRQHTKLYNIQSNDFSFLTYICCAWHEWVNWL